MTLIAKILDEKGRKLVSGSPDWTVFDAIKAMAENNIGSLVVQENDRIVGIFTERDYLRKIALKFRSSRETTLSEVMTTSVITAAKTDTVDAVMRAMTENRCRHMPIVEDERPIGLVSIGDLVKETLAEKEQEVEQLSSYIQGSY